MQAGQHPKEDAMHRISLFFLYYSTVTELYTLPGSGKARRQSIGQGILSQP